MDRSTLWCVFGVLAAVAATSRAETRKEAEARRDVCKGDGGHAPLVPIASGESTAGTTFVFGPNGAMTPATISARADSVFDFRSLGGDRHLVKVSLLDGQTVGCGWIDAKNRYRLRPGLQANSAVAIDVYRYDQASADAVLDLKNDLLSGHGAKSQPRGDAEGAVAEDKFSRNLDEILITCSKSAAVNYESHQELLYEATDVYSVKYNDSAEYQLVPADKKLWLIVTDVLADETTKQLPTIKIVQKKGEAAGFTLYTLAKLALPIVTKSLKFDPLAEIESGQCPENPTEPSTTTRVLALNAIDNHYDYQVSVCNNEKCPGDKDANLKSSVKLEPSPKGRWTLMTELSFGLGITGWHFTEHSDQVGLSSQTAPVFEPILGAGGPEQVFELREKSNPQNAFTTSLLLGYHVSDRYVVAAGPSLTIGSDGAALSQLSARVARNLYNSGVYFTAGLSSRFVNAPEFYAIGDRVSIAQTPGMMATAPKFASHTAVLLQVDIGLAIDLGTLVSGASGLITAFGGPK